MEELKFESFIILKLLVSTILGGFIGGDRERRGMDAGIRTYAAVCLGAAIFTSIAEHLEDLSAMSRIISNIVMGIGFLGAGLIYRNNSSNTLHGLTTAATLWCTAAVGVAVGLKMFLIAPAATLIIYFLLSMERRSWYITWRNKLRTKHNSMDSV